MCIACLLDNYNNIRTHHYIRKHLAVVLSSNESSTCFENCTEVLNGTFCCVKSKLKTKVQQAK